MSRDRDGQISGIARMNIAAASDEALADLRRFFASVAEGDSELGRETAPAYRDAIDEQIALREQYLRAVATVLDPPRCWSCGHPCNPGCKCDCCWDPIDEDSVDG